MKLFRYCAMASALLLTSVPAAYAADGSTIAVVNIQQILANSTAAKSIREQLSSKQKAFQADISKKEEQLQKEDQELAKQKGVLSKDAFEEKVRAFRSKASEVQKEVQSKKSLLDNAFERSLTEIQKVTTDIIAELSKEKGFVVAVPTSQILYADNKLDISEEVLKRLNDKMPKMDVKFDAPAKKSDGADEKK